MQPLVHKCLDPSHATEIFSVPPKQRLFASPKIVGYWNKLDYSRQIETNDIRVHVVQQDVAFPACGIHGPLLIIKGERHPCWAGRPFFRKAFQTIFTSWGQHIDKNATMAGHQAQGWCSNSKSGSAIGSSGLPSGNRRMRNLFVLVK